MKKQLPKKILSISEFAELVGVPPRRVRDWIGAGRLAAIRLGPRSLRISEAEALRFLHSAKVG